MLETEPYSPEKLPGLTTAQADALYVAGQDNSISPSPNRTISQFLSDTFINVFNFDLLGMGLALWILGRPQDAFISILILLLNVSFSSVLAVRNWRQMERLLALTSSKASLFRDDQIRAVDPDRIVPGDAVIIGPGDQFFTDGVLISNSPLRIDDYAVNGSENFVTLEAGDPVFAGSFCVTGHGVYEVTAVGEDRRWSSIQQKASRTGRYDTPLQKLIGGILKALRILVIMLVAVVLLQYFFSPDVSDEVYDVYVRAILVIFSIAPSGLLFMILITYISGAAQIGPLGVIIRRPETIEALAQVEVLCVGKTGTLTGGDAEIESLLDEESSSGISDTRLPQLVGSFARSASNTTPLLRILVDSFPGTQFEPVEEAPFLALFGWQALTFEAEELVGTYVLGFERFVTPLLDSNYVILPPKDSHKEPLFFAYTPDLLDLFADNRRPIIPRELIPLARIYLGESVREDAIITTEAFLDAGVDVKILSSDTVDAVVAAAVAVGLVESGAEDAATMSGRELDSAAPEGLFEQVTAIDIYGRLAPHQKELVVETLRDNGVQVTMMGETVMEVPAMRAADIGITMRSSNQAALNEADIVLLDNSLEVLPDVLELGQGVFNRLLDAMKLSLSHAFLVCWLALIAIFAGPRYFPYAKSQSLAIVLFTITIPSIMLSFWLVAGKVDAEDLTKRLFAFVGPASLTMTALVMAVFLVVSRESGVAYARTAVAHTLVLSGLILIIFVQPPNKFWAGGDSVSGDRRPTELVIVLYLVFVVIAQGSGFRGSAFAIDPLRSFADFLIVWLLTAVWVLLLRSIWRSAAVRRWSGFSLEPAGEILEG